ncbi:hypothetical protein Tco_0611500 [Tanacetum coccineum]
MVAYLEKTDGNTEFHQIMDFLTRSSIYYALTVSPIVSTSFVEQFWTTAKSRTVNNISYIDATVAGKPVTISEASIRSDLLFDDADGIDSLNNQAIFDNIQLMGHSPSLAIPDSNPQGSGGNHKGQSSSERSLSGNKDGLTLQSVYDLYISLYTQMKSVALKTRLARKTSLKKTGVQKGYVSKQGRKSVKSSKGEPFVYKDPAFDDFDDDAMDYMETKDAQDEGRTSFVVLEEKESADKEVSTEAPVSTVKPNEGTDKRNKGKSATQTASTTTSTPTPTIFGDDETIAQVLITMSQNKQKEKEKGVEIRNVEDTERPRPTSTRFVLTLKPLPKIDPKDKGKNMIDEEGESDTESDDITEAEKKFKMLAKDEEVARKVQEEWEAEGEKKRLAEGEKKRLAEEEATKVALTNEYDFIQTRFLLRSFKRKKERSLPLNKEQNFFMIPLLHKGNFLLNKDTTKVPAEQEVTEQGTKKRKNGHMKMIARKRLRPQPDDDSCTRFVSFYDDLVMKQYSEITPEDIELILWGDLKIMMESSTKENDQGDFWNNQQEWEIVRWRLYEACRVCILELKDGLSHHHARERRYLSPRNCARMLDLGLEVEEESTACT